MPGIKRKRKFFKRGKRRRFRYLRGRRNLRRAGVPKGLFPKVMKVQMKYAETGSLATTAGNVAKNWYSCNSIYDPRDAAGGHQPRGHDTFATLYNHYTVIYSQAKVVFSLPAETRTWIVSLGIVKDTSSGPSAPTDMMEQRSQRFALCTTTSIDAAKTRTLTMPWSIKHLRGARALVRTPFGQDPDDEEHWVVAAADAGAGATTNAVTFVIFIRYIVILTEAVKLAES